MSTAHVRTALPRRASTAGDAVAAPGATAVIVLILGLAYAFNGMDRSVFPALLAPINQEFGLTLTQGGFLSNIFTLNIALFGALAGWFMARFGRKRTLVGGLIAYSVFTFLIPLARGYVELAVLRAMTGAGEGLHIAASYSLLGAYFARRRGTFLGINNSFFGVGTFFGPLIGTQIFAGLGSWRPPFYLYGVAGVLAALAVLFLVPSTFSEKVDDERPDASGRAADCPERLLNANCILCVAAFFLTGYSFLAYTALYTLFLRDALGYSVAAAGAAFSMYGIGALTALVGGWVGERLGRYSLAICLAVMAAVGALMFARVHALAGQMLLSFVFGAMLSGFLYPRFIAVAQRSVQPDQIGAAMSIMIPVFYLAGFIAGPVFGALVSAVGWPAAGLLSVTATAALAAVITGFISPARMRGV
jgi:MFS family permease